MNADQSVLPRRFILERTVDVSGVSGTGLVAYGTTYPGGRTTLAWCASDVASVTIYDSPEQVEQIHGHGGATVLEWIDDGSATTQARIDAPLATIGEHLVALSGPADPPVEPDISTVRSIDGALVWIADTSRICAYVAEIYDLPSYAIAARALATVRRRMLRHDDPSLMQILDDLAAAFSQLRVRASLCRQFAEHDVARGLTLAAADLAGLAAHLASFGHPVSTLASDDGSP